MRHESGGDSDGHKEPSSPGSGRVKKEAVNFAGVWAGGLMKLMLETSLWNESPCERERRQRPVLLDSTLGCDRHGRAAASIESVSSQCSQG